MNDEEKEKPILHDGFKSRKFIATAVGTGIIEVAAIVGWLVLDKMSAVEFSSLNQWLWPLALGIFCGTSVWEKFAYRRPAK